MIRSTLYEQADGSTAGENLDIGLVDIQMPVFDGLSATEEICRSEAGTQRHVPIVALTAHAMQSDQQRCLDSEIDSYLTKPIDPSALDQVLSAHGKRRTGAVPVRRAG